MCIRDRKGISKKKRYRFIKADIGNRKKIKKILNNYLNSEEFKKIMIKYDEWQLGSKPVYFPST